MKIFDKEAKETKVALVICLIAFSILWGNYFIWYHGELKAELNGRMPQGSTTIGVSEVVP